MISITVNGRPYQFDGDSAMPLLWYLRDELGLTGTKFGCGVSACGACTVHVDGNAVRSCVTPVSAATAQPVTTLEGLAGGGGGGDNLHPLQQAFVQEQAGQCAYCIPGMIMSAAALLQQAPKPTDDEIKTALAGNLCRCGSHMRIMRAVKRAAGVSA